MKCDCHREIVRCTAMVARMEKLHEKRQETIRKNEQEFAQRRQELKELKDSGEAITPKAWQLEIDQLAAGKQADTLAMKSMREDLKAVERLRKTAEQLSRQERDKPHDREPER